MDYAGSSLGPSAGPVDSSRATNSVKIVIAGGVGVGKTTFVGAVSEIMPLSTEAMLSAGGTEMRDLAAVLDAQNTTVAIDFGRVSLDADLILYLLGCPGQGRLWFGWDDLIRGAIGAVVLVDPRHLVDSFAAIDYFEDRGLPFIVAHNLFYGLISSTVEQVREALSLPEDVPVIALDSRDRAAVKSTLITLVEYVLAAPRL